MTYASGPTRQFFTTAPARRLKLSRLDNPRSMKPIHGPWLAAGLLLTACAPALDWREVRLADSTLSAYFPCKPEHQARQVRLGAQAVRMVLYACTADNTTWALALADTADPALVATALAELRASAQRNMGAATVQVLQLDVEGATPNPQAQRVAFAGHMPDGRAVSEHLAVFAKGTVVFQATVLGESLALPAADTFFASLRFAP
jgi:hypothetical protein